MDLNWKFMINTSKKTFLVIDHDLQSGKKNCNS